MNSVWKEKTLGDILTFQRGHDLPKTEFQPGKYPIAASNGIIGYHNQFTTAGPSITIGRSGSIGQPYYYPADFWAHNTTLYVKEFKDCDPKFAFYLLQQIDFNVYNSGSAVPSLNRNFLHPIQVSIPPLNYQTRIAEILSSLDDKIELNRQMNQTLEEMAQAIYKHHFVDGIDPDNLPEGWKKGKVDDCFNVTMGQSPNGKSYNEAGNGMVFFQGRTDFAFRFPEVRMFTTEPKRIANPGDTLISVRAPVGDVNISEVECCIGRGLAAVNHKQGAQSFTYYTLKNMKSEFDKYNGEGTVFGSINKDSFLNITLPIPPEEIIRNFEIKSNDLDSLVLSLSLEIRNLIDIRNYLLPKLISGEILPKDLKQIEEVL